MKWSDYLHKNNNEQQEYSIEKQIIYAGKHNATHKYEGKLKQTGTTNTNRIVKMGHLCCQFRQYFQRLVDLITHIEN